MCLLPATYTDQPNEYRQAYDLEQTSTPTRERGVPSQSWGRFFTSPELPQAAVYLVYENEPFSRYIATDFAAARIYGWLSGA